VNVADFDFTLPEELIAQEPPRDRGQSRLLVLHRGTGAVDHTEFARLGDYLVAGDLLVVNNTRVFPARLIGHRVPSGGAVECLLIRQLPTSTPNSQLPTPNAHEGTSRLGVGSDIELGIGSSEMWEALVHPGQKLKPGARVVFEGEGLRLDGEILDRHFFGRRTLRLWTDDADGVTAVIDRLGHMPLPPYIKRADRPCDRERYQTVYARERGSIAAPTAGLHFTDELLAGLDARGVRRAEVTLHVGYGTFKPVRVERVEDHVVDPELFEVTRETAAALTTTRRDRRRIIAVGTTTVRALESLTIDAAGTIQAACGETRTFIHPGHAFRIVDALITNFHLPRSSLLMLVAAFAGRERILAAYREAIARRYRFYSYGDAMLIV
jgi:S-adenosylmethionine:tRNA ribosyltransferase-isomerase